MITYKVSNLSNINQYLELYKRCFKNFGKNFNYLNWLYKKNPLGDYVGIDAFHNNNLIGQIGGIPYNFKFKNNILKTLVSINICVDENYRGKKIFLNLSKSLFPISPLSKIIFLFLLAKLVIVSAKEFLI